MAPGHLTRTERAAILSAAVVAHGGLMLWLAHISFVQPVPTDPGMKVFALPAAVVAPAPPPPPPPRPPLPALEPPAPAAPPPDAVGATISAACAPLDAITQAIEADPAARAAVEQAPRSARSVAEALVIWNERWTDLAVPPDAPLTPVRATVMRALVPLAPACLEASITGPRLLPIAGARGTTLLVFGSGVWSWQDLTVADAEAEPRFETIFAWP